MHDAGPRIKSSSLIMSVERGCDMQYHRYSTCNAAHAGVRVLWGHHARRK